MRVAARFCGSIPWEEPGLPATFQGTACPDTDPSFPRGGAHRAPPPAKATVLVSRAPLRREVAPRAFCGLACWWSATRWVEHVRLVYLRHYQLLRPALTVATGGGVSLEAVLAVAATHAGVADFRTGRSSRPVVGALGLPTGLVVATGLAPRTVRRARTFLRLAGLATEIAGGRHRTRPERLESWRRGDRCRGWAADYALHPSRTHPVDPGPVGVVDRRCADGSPPRSGSVPTTTSDSTVVSTTRRGSRGSRRQSRAPDPDGVALAAQWRRHPHAPAWVSTVSATAWSGLLALPARHGWTADDLDQLLRGHVAAGSVIPRSPRQPIGFLSWVLNRADLAQRPTARADARKAATLQRAQQRAAEGEQRRQANRLQTAAGTAALRGPGRAAVHTVLDDIRRRRAARGTD